MISRKDGDSVTKKAIKKTQGQLIEDMQEKLNDRYTDGLLYAVQQLVMFADQPSLAADYLMLESNLPMDDFIRAQKRSGYENEKMIPFIKETFKDQ